MGAFSEFCVATPERGGTGLWLCGPRLINRQEVQPHHTPQFQTSSLEMALMSHRTTAGVTEMIKYRITQGIPHRHAGGQGNVKSIRAVFPAKLGQPPCIRMCRVS